MNLIRNLRAKKPLLKLHLGCWKRNIPGFTNIDICNLPHIHYQRSVDNLSVFPDSSVELIYASHVLEYFDRQEAEKVLKEWYRVLAPYGVLRVAVPDFLSLIKVYKKHGDLDKILGPLYGRMAVAAKREKKIIYHKTVYDLKSLGKLLKSAGFKNIRCYDWRKTIHKDYDDHSQAYLPHMDKKHGLLISLNVEAVK